MTMQQSPFGNVFRDFLEETSEGQLANFLSRLPGGLPLGQFNFARSLFAPTLDQFRGDIGRQIRSEQAPTLRFEDFLNRFDLPRMVARQQGGPTEGLTSRARFLF